MNMLGVAYEVAAILGREVKLPETAYQAGAEKAADYISVKIEGHSQTRAAADRIRAEQSS